jgi:hypothetical protein
VYDVLIYFPVKGSFFGLGGKSALGETAKAMLLRMGVHAMPSLDQVLCTHAALILMLYSYAMPSLDQLVEMISNGNTEGAANSEAAGSAAAGATAGATTCAANDHACTAAAGKKQGASVLSEQAESALFYLAKNIRSLYEGKHIPGHAKFLPTNQGMRTIKDCFSEDNPLGFPVIEKRWHDLGSALKLPKAPEFSIMLESAIAILSANGTTPGSVGSTPTASSATDTSSSSAEGEGGGGLGMLSNEERGKVLIRIDTRTVLHSYCTNGVKVLAYLSKRFEEKGVSTRETCIDYKPGTCTVPILMLYSFSYSHSYCTRYTPLLFLATPTGFLTGGDNLHQTFVRTMKEARDWCDTRTHAHTLHSYCTHTVLILYSYCTHTVLYCTHTALILHSYCTHTVLILCSCCTHTLLHSHTIHYRCDTRIKCVGFTFQGDKNMKTGAFSKQGRFEVWFKTSSAWHTADGWHSYLKV